MNVSVFVRGAKPDEFPLSFYDIEHSPGIYEHNVDDSGSLLVVVENQKGGHSVFFVCGRSGRIETPFEGWKSKRFKRSSVASISVHFFADHP